MSTQACGRPRKVTNSTAVGATFGSRIDALRRRSSGVGRNAGSLPRPVEPCSLLASSRKDPKILPSSNAGRTNGAIEAHCFARRLAFARRWHFARSESTSMRSDIFPKDRELDRAATLQGTRHLEFSHQSTRRKVNADECFAEGHLGRANELYWKAPSIDQKHSKALTNRTALHLVMSHR